MNNTRAKIGQGALLPEQFRKNGFTDYRTTTPIQVYYDPNPDQKQREELAEVVAAAAAVFGGAAGGPAAWAAAVPIVAGIVQGHNTPATNLPTGYHVLAVSIPNTFGKNALVAFSPTNPEPSENDELVLSFASIGPGQLVPVIPSPALPVPPTPTPTPSPRNPEQTPINPSSPVRAGTGDQAQATGSTVVQAIVVLGALGAAALVAVKLWKRP